MAAHEKQIGITLIRQRTAALADYGVDDLKNTEKVAALVRTAKEVNDQMKELKDQDKKVKDEFKRICKPYTDDGKKVTCYDFEKETKMTLTFSGGGMELDERKLLEGIYEMYGEEFGDKTGKAWEAFCAISDPVEIPRAVNEQKLLAEISRAKLIVSGVESGDIKVTEEIVNAATAVTKPSLVAKIMDMNKGEKAQLDAGELTEPMKVE